MTENVNAATPTRILIWVAILAIIAGCTLVYRSNHVDLRENRAVVGASNRVTDVKLSPR